MRIIFLDIDGPIINVSSLVMVSELRLACNKVSIQLLNDLCLESGAKIVTNSMHNYHLPYGKTLKEDLIHWGIDPTHFHNDWRTIFPNIDYTDVTSTVRGIGRLIAINQWIADNGECDWVCFDDRKFTESKRLVYIEDGEGLQDEHILAAIEVFSLRQEK